MYDPLSRATVSDHGLAFFCCLPHSILPQYKGSVIRSFLDIVPTVHGFPMGVAISKFRLSDRYLGYSLLTAIYSVC